MRFDLDTQIGVADPVRGKRGFRGGPRTLSVRGSYVSGLVRDVRVKVNGVGCTTQMESQPELEEKFGDYPVRVGFRAESLIESSDNSVDVEVAIDGEVRYSEAVDVQG